MIDTLLQLSPWHWLSIAVVILVVEMLVGSYYLLWISFAAFITAILHWAFALGWEAQLLIFTIISMISVIAWYQYDKKRVKKSPRPLLNKRGHQYIGRIVELSQAIENGVGKINVDDSTWKVRGEDAPVNSRVKIVDIDGTVLIVDIVGD